MMQINIISSVKQINYHRYVLLVLLVVLMSDRAEPCRGGRLLGTGITAADKQQILDAHNLLRSSVAQGQVPNQPGAQNMQEMVWDDELASRAQQWANQCTFEHDPSRSTNRFTMGQNLAIIWSTIPLREDEGNFPSRIKNWFKEVQKYAWGSSWSPATGHYSQLVWGDTYLIGCGYSYYQTSSRFNKLYVCNYGPGGNVVGSNPYQVGTPSCSNFGMYPSSRYSGLCINTQSGYTPQNNYVTQNTYTFKSERVNPVRYQTYRIPNTAVSLYQRALQTYNRPQQSYGQALQNYQSVLQAYATAYSPPQRQYHSYFGGATLFG